ncbi:hypothetical protein EDD66_105109 [Mobilisporobacter senegalensis]|uniref:Uncharacterized protein n=1 Tax=Mobilisporobacter senegalensis TaxID=1329262 RepID=A0A3N1XN94_9FIRM|nr:hypothetical protein [Mobilisporobacter senegalensis]ROR28170.1 hypothetical protein EDD66_105109 [Mobilisporobacter senegalensis]
MTYKGREFIDNIREFFEENDNWQDTTKYEVIERFPLYGERRYTLYNLLCEIDGLGKDEMVVFYDAEDVLIEDITRVLNMFLVTSVKKVSYECKFGNEHIVKFKFSDGYIEIREAKANKRIA